MKFLGTVAAALLLSSGAFAADAVFSGDSVPTAAPAAPAFDWTGAYFGVNAGYGGGKLKPHFYAYDNEFDEYLDASASASASGFVGGVQAGYNFQSGSMVYGVETDIQYSNVEAKLSGSVSSSIFGLDASASGSVKGSVEWFGTTRARVGFTPTDRFLVYGTGGVAYGKYKLKAEGSYDIGDINDTGSVSTSKSKVGWTVGAGTEYAITDNLTFKAEYLYTNLGRWNLLELGDADAGLKLSSKLDFHTVRVGLNYKF